MQVMQVGFSTMSNIALAPLLLGQRLLLAYVRSRVFVLLVVSGGDRSGRLSRL